MKAVYRVRLTPTAKEMLEATEDRRVQEKIRDRIDGLAREAEKQGKPLIGELAGYRSLRAVGQRHRVIYRVRRSEVVVLVVALRIRKEGDRGDIYALARKLLRLHLLEPISRRE